MNYMRHQVGKKTPLKFENESMEKIPSIYEPKYKPKELKSQNFTLYRGTWEMAICPVWVEKWKIK